MPVCRPLASIKIDDTSPLPPLFKGETKISRTWALPSRAGAAPEGRGCAGAIRQ